MESIIIGSILGHIGICYTFYRFIKIKKIELPMSIFPMIIFIPLWGIFCAAAVIRTSQYESDDKLTAEDSLDFSFSVSSRIFELDEQSDIIPLEEAMLINDSFTRRTLVMEILQKNPAQYLPVLKKAGFIGDAEVMHYSAATIMNMQEELETELFKAKHQYQLEPDAVSNIKYYVQILQKYINSCFLEGNAMWYKRIQYGHLLSKLISSFPDDFDIFLQWLDNQIELGENRISQEAIETAIQKWGSDERLLLLSMKLNVRMKCAKGIQDTVSMIEKNQTFLSPKIKEITKFWTFNKRLDDEKKILQ